MESPVGSNCQLHLYKTMRSAGQEAEGTPGDNNIHRCGGHRPVFKSQSPHLLTLCSWTGSLISPSTSSLDLCVVCKWRLIYYECQAWKKRSNGGHYHFNNRKLEDIMSAALPATHTYSHKHISSVQLLRLPGASLWEGLLSGSQSFPFTKLGPLTSRFLGCSRPAAEKFRSSHSAPGPTWM